MWRCIKISSWIVLCLLAGVVNADKVKIPDFKLPTDSAEVTPAQLNGKVVYVDFWASWCKPCKKSFPWLNEMQKKYEKQGLVVLGINLDEDKSQAEAFLKKVPAGFKIAYDPEGKSAKDFHVQGMPSSYLVDREGYVVNRHVGFREKDAEALEQHILELLK